MVNLGRQAPTRGCQAASVNLVPAHAQVRFPSLSPDASRKSLSGVLVSRTALFASFQAGVALALAAGGTAQAWDASTRWWPLVAVAANMVSVGLLWMLLRREGRGYFSLFPRSRETWARDLGLTALVFVVAAPISMLPGPAIAGWLFDDPAAATSLLLQPLPLWAWAACLAFPVTIAFAELPTYFGYVLPRLEARTGSPLVAVLACASFLALQHAALPLVLDPRFMLWRVAMFAPLAVYLGAVLRARPRLFPYVVAAHALSDLSVVLMIPIG